MAFPRLRITATVVSSWLFAAAAAACRVGWHRVALRVLSPVSAFNHATLHAPYPGRAAVMAFDRTFAHGIAAAQLAEFAALGGGARDAWGAAYLACLGSAFLMFYVAYPKSGDWHRHHALLHAVCAGGSVAFDAATRGRGR